MWHLVARWTTHVRQCAVPLFVAVADMVRKPWKGLLAAISGIKTQGDMAPEIPLENAQKADFVFEKVVEDQLRRAEVHSTGAEGSDEDSRAA